jgi:fido (protein-threonine AMPylation protein)
VAARRTDLRRDSKPTSPALFVDAEEKAFLEARNGLLQFDEVVRVASLAIQDAKRGRAFKLRPSNLQTLQRLAIQDVYRCAGNYRTGPVVIVGTNHEPPPPEQVPELVEEMCEYVTENWSRTAVHLASYIMWRLNWIHPFSGGNGRTSRTTSYLVMCARAGLLFPGARTIPDQIVEDRKAYYEALDAADLAAVEGGIDVSVMETLLGNMLAAQLLSAHAQATT